ncbi:hypothetical protein [Kribbella sp. NPDC051770]|uniref:hypothetical protein n=1 Tax=Kribbella sp. NPDC051770 TaxID=3155413 RepID=UPI00343289EF
MRRQTAAAVAAVSMLAGTIGLTPAAQAAYPTKSFDITYGATYARGKVTFYNRSVHVSGVERAVPSSGCRFVEVWTYNASGDLDFQAEVGGTCNGVVDFNVDVAADAPGGASYVVVKFWYRDSSWNNQRVLTSAKVLRP